MELILKLKDFDTDRNDIPINIKGDMDESFQINIWSEPFDYELDPDQRYIYNVWLEFGKDCDSTLMFAANLDDLEMFACQLTKSIEMIRRDWPDAIKYERQPWIR